MGQNYVKIKVRLRFPLENEMKGGLYMARITFTEEKRNISEGISIDKFERSIARISSEIEQQEDRKRFSGRRFGPGSVEEELKGITMLDSILSPYELLSK